MLRRINKLKNVGLFEDLRSGSGPQHEFARFNVVYALNAAGKSTLCDIFRSLGSNNAAYINGRKRFGATGDIEIEVLLGGSPTPRATWITARWTVDPSSFQVPPFLIYDDRFVSENVFIGSFVDVEHRRALYGLALGARGQALKQSVDDAENALSTATATLASARNALSALVPTGFTIETFKTLAKVDDVDERIAESEANLDAARRKKQSIDEINKRPPLPVFPLPVLPTNIEAVLESTLDEAALVAESTVREHLQHRDQPLPLDWAALGHRSQSGTACPYCAQEMEGLPLFAAYRAFFSGALQQQQNERKRLEIELEKQFGESPANGLTRVLTAYRVELEWWRDAVGAQIDLPIEVSSEYVGERMAGVFAALSQAIQRKKENPSERVVLSEDESRAISQWQDVGLALNKLLAAVPNANVQVAAQKHAAGIVDLTVLNNRLAELRNQKARHQAAVVAAYEAFDAAAANKAQKETAKTTANSVLRAEAQALFADYGSQINTLLQRFGVDFRLVSGGIAFHGGPPAGDLAIELLGSRVSATLADMRDPSRPSLANTLSGGDRSALALAFFLAVVQRDPNLANSIVFFDDPFHGQDRSRRQRTIECIHEIALTAAQCFVLSHELDFAHSAARCPDAPAKTFSFDDSGQHLLLAACDLPDGPARTYEQDFAELSGYVQRPSGTPAHLKSVARCIRQTLEYYLRVKFPEQFTATEWLGDMIGKLRNASSGPLASGAHLVGDLGQINEWGKRFYHGETDGSVAGQIDPREMLNYVQQTIRVISE